MIFQMILEIPKTPADVDVKPREYDPELDDVGSVLRDICEILDRLGARFVVRICSDQLWPVTVRTDMLVVLEQITDVLALVSRDQTATLDFYEQGIERVVKFVPKGDIVEITCHELIIKPSMVVASTTGPREVVVDVLCKLATDFISASASHVGTLVAHPWFTNWAHNVERIVNRTQSLRSFPH